jgi:hypothetical protein
VHTHAKEDKVQSAVTLTWATAKVEKKSKDATSGAATRCTRRDILVRRCCGRESLGAQKYHFEGLIEAPCTCDKNLCRWGIIAVCLHGAPTAIGRTV